MTAGPVLKVAIPPSPPSLKGLVPSFKPDRKEPTQPNTFGELFDYAVTCNYPFYVVAVVVYKDKKINVFDGFNFNCEENSAFATTIAAVYYFAIDCFVNSNKNSFKLDSFYPMPFSDDMVASIDLVGKEPLLAQPVLAMALEGCNPYMDKKYRRYQANLCLLVAQYISFRSQSDKSLFPPNYYKQWIGAIKRIDPTFVADCVKLVASTSSSATKANAEPRNKESHATLT